MKNSQASPSDAVYNQILIRIAEGKWKEGDKLPPERELARMFSVSRVSVRSALQRLSGQGLVNIVNAVGSFVSVPQLDAEIAPAEISDISGKAFLEFFEFRQAIEFKAIDRFVEHATPAHYQALADIVDRMYRCGQDDWKTFTDLDFEYHMTIIRETGNRFLYDSMEYFSNHYYHYLEEINRLVPKSIADAADEHAADYKALLSGNAEQVKMAMLQDNTHYHLAYFHRNDENR